MSSRIVISCDGTPKDRPGMSLERCRAFLPTGTDQRTAARAIAARDGWTLHRGRDLCPGCTSTRRALA